MRIESAGAGLPRQCAARSLVSSAAAAVIAIAVWSCMPVGGAAPERTGAEVPTARARPAPTVAQPSGAAASVGSRGPDRSLPGGSAVPTPKVDAVPTRVVVRDLKIDLPVIRPAHDEAYPLCDVAEFLPAYGLPGLPGITFIYAHAQAGMFLPILEASRKADGAALVGVGVDLYTADGFRRHYAITEIHRHVRSFDPVNDLRGDGVVLQTSETDHHAGTKLMVVARPFGGPERVSATEAGPDARPRVCGD